MNCFCSFPYVKKALIQKENEKEEIFHIYNFFMSLITIILFFFSSLTSILILGCSNLRQARIITVSRSVCVSQISVGTAWTIFKIVKNDYEMSGIGVILILRKYIMFEIGFIFVFHQILHKFSHIIIMRLLLYLGNIS